MTDAPVSLPSAQPPGAPPASGLAIGALVCGSVGALLALVGICTFGITAALGIIVGIVGLILSIMAIRRIRRSAGQMGGRGLAVGGLATSIAAIVLGLLIAAAMGGLMFFAFSQAKDEAQQGRIAAARVDIANIEVAMDTFEVDCGRFPSTEEGLQALLDQPSVATGWKGPYLKRSTPKDPWGNLYLYRCPGQHNPNRYDLYSFGPDGLDGTEDDIGNWSEVP
ncbi:MAG: type II secretion system major pseudopilin GspG [Planctomycetes bacterium]|nr:type II secretion system major pseudopilin GspG [Planctomycetota bacterium]